MSSLIPYSSSSSSFYFSKPHPLPPLSSSSFSSCSKPRPLPAPLSLRVSKTKCAAKNISLPPSVDWRKRGAMNPVIDQEDCYCCSIIPVVGAVEAAIWIQTGKLLQLSIQEIIDCQGDGLGCDGGYAIDTFEYIRVHGVTTERSYPFKRINGTCQREKAKLPRYYIRGYEVVPPLDELEMMRAVARQPVMATVCSIGPYATYKKSDGILREPYMWGKIHPICHCVLVAGYDTSDQGEPYWIVKDSRGTKYGDEGYVYLYRGGPEHGPFGLYREAFYPIL